MEILVAQSCNPLRFQALSRLADRYHECKTWGVSALDLHIRLPAFRSCVWTQKSAQQGSVKEFHREIEGSLVPNSNMLALCTTLFLQMVFLFINAIINIIVFFFFATHAWDLIFAGTLQ